jgi:hypothetical protein
LPISGLSAKPYNENDLETIKNINNPPSTSKNSKQKEPNVGGESVLSSNKVRINEGMSDNFAESGQLLNNINNNGRGPRSNTTRLDYSSALTDEYENRKFFKLNFKA